MLAPVAIDVELPDGDHSQGERRAFQRQTNQAYHISMGACAVNIATCLGTQSNHWAAQNVRSLSMHNHISEKEEDRFVITHREGCMIVS